jgi:hypothetical protein
MSNELEFEATRTDKEDMNSALRDLRTFFNEAWDRIAKLEKRLQNLQSQIDGEYFGRIATLEESVLEYSPSGPVRRVSVPELEKRVAILEQRNLSSTTKKKTHHIEDEE